MAYTFLQRLDLEHGNMGFTVASVASLGAEFGMDAAAVEAALIAAQSGVGRIRTHYRRGVWSCFHNPNY